MRITTLAALAYCAVALSACGNTPSEKLADRVENAADKRADVIESNADTLRAQAKSLDDQAEVVRDTAESRADAIKAADMKVKNMTQAQRDAIVANKAPAVR